MSAARRRMSMANTSGASSILLLTPLVPVQSHRSTTSSPSTAFAALNSSEQPSPESSFYRPANGWSYSAIPLRATSNGVPYETNEPRKVDDRIEESSRQTRSQEGPPFSDSLSSTFGSASDQSVAKSVNVNSSNCMDRCVMHDLLKAAVFVFVNPRVFGFCIIRENRFNPALTIMLRN